MSLLNDDLLASLDTSVADVATAATLPPEMYPSDEFLGFEKQALFIREWL